MNTNKIGYLVISPGTGDLDNGLTLMRDKIFTKSFGADSIITPDQMPIGFRPHLIFRLGVFILSILFPYYTANSKFLYWALLQCRKTSSDNTIVVHTHLMGFLVFFLQKRKVLYYKTDSILRIYRSSKRTGPKLLLKYARILFEKIYIRYIERHATCIIYVNNIDQQTDDVYRSSNNSYTIENGANIEDIRYTYNGSAQFDFNCVFHGDLSYPPNKEAICSSLELIENINLQTNFNLHLYVFGPHSEELRHLNSRHYSLMGYVDDINMVFENKDLYLAIIDNGAGQKNKVMDALASGLPIFCTLGALSGREDIDSLCYITEKSTFHARCNDLILCLEKLRKQNESEIAKLRLNRQKVLSRYTWKATNERLIGILSGTHLED